MDKNIVKNQHYIPESLLWHFVNSKRKFFEVFLSDKRIYLTSPGSSMCAKFIYEVDDLKINTIEKYFSKIETEVAPQVQELIEIINKHKTGKIKFSAIKTLIENLLSTFIIFYYRSGALLIEFSSLDVKDKIPLLSQKILNKKYINALSNTIKSCYRFAIIESDNAFIMSDQFISTAALKIKGQFENISNRHIGIRDTLILIPISSSYYAVFWHADDQFFLKENSINCLDLEEIKIINQAIIDNSYAKCISTKKENLENVLDNYHYESPSQIFVGSKSGCTRGAIRKKETFFYDIDREAFKFFRYGIQSNLQKYITSRRNDPCPCNSRKKFKKCHQDIYERIKTPIQNIINQSHQINTYIIPNATTIELPIDEWGGYVQK